MEVTYPDGATPLPAFARSTSAVLKDLACDGTNGLSDADAAARLARDGPNSIAAAPPTPSWRRFLDQFADPLVYLLLAAIVISVLVWLADGAEGFPVDAVVVAVIVVANAVLGYVQERKAERAVAALQELTKSMATVVRNGEQRRLATADVVAGDIIALDVGDSVAADARVLVANALQIGEATLTGESAPVTKSTEAVASEAVIGDRTSMVYRGTAVVGGRGQAIVTATGSNTEVGRIAGMLDATESEQTPLQREIESVGRTLGLVVVVIAVVVVVSLIVVDGLRTGPELLSALLIGVSLAVAAVPEGLPAVLSVVLALGVQRMSKRNALIKRLVSVEALGSATIICTDKTGTLTRNEMMVRRLVVPSGEIDVTGNGYRPEGRLLFGGADLDDPVTLDEARWAAIAGRLASDASLVNGREETTALGDPTEAALVALAGKVGVDGETAGPRFERLAEIPFTAERRRMSTVQLDHQEGRVVMVTKGAPDSLLGRCRAERAGGEERPLTDADRNRWSEAIDRLGDDALRTLAVAYRTLSFDGDLDPDDLDLDGDTAEDDLVLLAVVGIMDPPRPEAGQAIEVAHQAGIRVAMVTGDHARTAASIASELGIADDGASVVSAAELLAADDDQLDELVRTTSVYARVAPEHKLRIVQALTRQGEIVAMTGDGVNDAPALKAASIGVAMGVTGTDVSKEAADMILTDDNFATIVAAVDEGRAIFHNIRSFLRYLLSSNVGEVLAVFLGVIGASIIGLTGGDGPAAPLLAVQILWINLITDTGPALALGVDPPPPGLMQRRPRRLSERIVDRRMQAGIGLIGLTMALSTLAMLDAGLPGGLIEGDGDLPTARTAAFTVLVLAQLFNAFAARSETDSTFVGLFSNRWLVATVFLSFVLQVAVVHVPVLNRSFGTVPLGLDDWIVAAALASSVIWVAEIRKLVLRRRTPTADLD